MSRRVHRTKACKLRPHDVLRLYGRLCELHMTQAASATGPGSFLAHDSLARQYSRDAFALVAQFETNRRAAGL